MLLLLILMVLKNFTSGLGTLKVHLSTFSIKSKPVFSNGPQSMPKNPPDCPILCSSVFENFILSNEPFAKAL